MHVNELNYWVPENSFDLEETYKNKSYPARPGTIGFYSSAMWLREKLGRIDLKDNAFMNEQNLFKLLVTFVEQNSQYKLIVFSHPIEKKNKEAARTYYDQLSGNIQLADVDFPNDKQFFNRSEEHT